MTRELVLYADESVGSGPHFSNFYGGCVVESKALRGVTTRLEARKTELNLHGEVKWQKVTANYLAKYDALIEAFFAEVAANAVKVRIMFTQNMHVPVGLTPRQHDDRYFILYYQFIKHAFGLRYAGLPDSATRIRLHFDQIPDTFERREQFRAYLAALTRISHDA